MYICQNLNDFGKYMNKIKRIILWFGLVQFICLRTIAAEYNQVQLISANNDYGLQLEWDKTFNTTSTSDNAVIMNVTYDSAGNFYVVGFFDGTLPLDRNTSLTQEGKDRNWFIAKYDINGDLIWAKKMYNKSRAILKQAQIVSPHVIKFMRDGSLMMLAELDPGELYYDGELLYQYDEGKSYQAYVKYQYLVLKIDPENGSIIKKLIPWTCFAIKGVAVDDKGFWYLHANAVRDFEGMNSDYPSKCRLTGKHSKYFAKMDEDFNMVWDFAINDNSQFDNYTKNGEENEDILLLGDTMYVFTTYSTKCNVSPDQDNPVYVDYVDYDRDKWENILIARYIVSGEKPVLKDFSSCNYLYLGCFSEDKNGSILGNLCRRDIPERKGCYHGVKITSDLKIDTLSAMPYKSYRSWRSMGQTHKYDKLGNLYNCCYIFDSDPIALDINDTLTGIKNNEVHINHFLVKYDSDLNFRYALGAFSGWWTLEDYYIDERRGAFIIRYNQSLMDINWDITNTSSKVYPESYSDGLVKYTETFRIREEHSDQGSIKQAGEMVRFGSDVNIEVVPNTGYTVDSVVTDRGELLQKQSDGTFLLENVTDKVILKAYYSSKTGMTDNWMAGFSAYPNPVTGIICVSGLSEFEYVITDIQGRNHLSGKTEDGCVRVESLPSGSYMLLINKNKAVRFEKK